MSLPDTSEGIPSIESLIAALQDKNSAVRVEAARALGALRDPRAVEPLAVLLTHLDKNSQIAAAKSLGEIGDPKAIQPLSDALRHESYETYDAIKDALTKLGAAEVVDTVAMARARAEASETSKEAGRSLLLWGAGLLGIGLVCSVGSYGFASVQASRSATLSTSGFGSAQYFVFSGPILLGGILLMIGFFRRQGAISIGKILASIAIGFFGFFDIFGVVLGLIGDTQDVPPAIQIPVLLGLLVGSLLLAIRLSTRPWRDIIIAGIVVILLLCLVSPFISTT